MSNSFSIPVECKLSTAEQSREMDSKTIEDFGIDGFTLMEMAASSAANHIKKLQGSEKSGLYLCGKGNNAGDALAVVRYLINDSNHKATLFFVLGDDDLSPDADKNLSLLKKLKDHGAEVSFIENFDGVDERSFDYIVDGIFGTGLNSELRSPLPDIVKKINTLSQPVYSMDVTSGLHADTGEILGGCIKADVTFTFGSNKIGLHWKNSRDYTGEVIFNNLPFPSTYRNWDAVLINQKLFDVLPAIKRKAKHKYDGGVVHIMAGSAGLTGAAIMSAKSAWKQGAGAVFLYAPKALMPIYEANLPNIIKIEVGDDDDTFFKEEHSDPIIESINKKKGILMAGPGIGTYSETGQCLLNVLKEQDGNVILDADGLSFWDEIIESQISEDQKRKWLLTPHIGEAVNYLGGSFQTDYERFEWAKEFTNQTNVSILIKGNPNVISISGGNNFITGYDTSMYSRAGFGDVLSGSLASYISISQSVELGVISALYNGYKRFKEFAESEPFGPEHLL